MRCALAITGDDPGDELAVHRATQWLLTREVTRRGDWATYVDAEPGGWYFEHHNVFYPDLDDTAMVLAALREHFVSGWTRRSNRPHGWSCRLPLRMW